MISLPRGREWSLTPDFCQNSDPSGKTSVNRFRRRGGALVRVVGAQGDGPAVIVLKSAAGDEVRFDSCRVLEVATGHDDVTVDGVPGRKGSLTIDCAGDERGFFVQGRARVPGCYGPPK